MQALKEYPLHPAQALRFNLWVYFTLVFVLLNLSMQEVTILSVKYTIKALKSTLENGQIK